MKEGEMTSETCQINVFFLTQNQLVPARVGNSELVSFS